MKTWIHACFSDESLIKTGVSNTISPWAMSSACLLLKSQLFFIYQLCCQIFHKFLNSVMKKINCHKISNFINVFNQKISQILLSENWGLCRTNLSNFFLYNSKFGENTLQKVNFFWKKTGNFVVIQIMFLNLKFLKDCTLYHIHIY